MPPRRALALLALTLAACGGAQDAAPPRSLLLVTIDTLRADRLGCYGDADARTPAIDALARRGVRFARAASVAPLTFPAHVSLMTGTIPPYHGARENGTFRAVPELATLAESLSARGLRTGAFTAAYVLDSQFGLDQGFEVYADVPQRRMSGGGLIVERPAGEVNQEALAWLRGLGADEPFFAWVHYFEPHLPYPPDAALPPEFRGRPYDAEVQAADRALGELLAGLEALGRTDETLVVLASDHGESLGEHGEKTHSFFVYQSVLHVPLVLAHASLPEGLVVEAPVSLVDVAPTALELLDVAPPALPPPARSLAPLLRGEPLAEAPAYFESLNPLLNYGWAPLEGVLTARFKLIRAPRPELYDLVADPRELENLHASEATAAAALERALDELLAQNAERSPGAGAGRELSAEDRARLMDLGYTGTATPGEVELTLLDPKDGIGRIRREEHLHELFAAGRVGEVLAVVEELLAEDPENPVFNAHYGFLMMAQSRYADALPYLRRSVDGGYVVADNLGNLGSSLLMTGRNEEAAQVLERALEVDAKHLPSLFALGQALLALGREDEARATLRRFLALWEGGEHPWARQAKAQLAALDG